MTGRTIGASLGFGVTCHAELHIERDFLGDPVALANRSVADFARCARRSMYTMAEVNERRELIDADPRNRPLLFGGGRQFLDVRAVRLYRLVTAHAETFRWKGHQLARVRILVACVALQSERQMRLVTVRNGLLLAKEYSAQ